MDEWIEKITFTPHQFYDTRIAYLARLRELGADLSYWVYDYTRRPDYLFEITDIYVEIPL